MLSNIEYLIFLYLFSYIYKVFIHIFKPKCNQALVSQLKRVNNNLSQISSPSITNLSLSLSCNETKLREYLI